MKFSIARIIECPNTKAAKYAFTLIELLIVMSLAGLLILAAVHLLINFTLLRSQSIGESHFESHAYNLRRFLDAGLAGKESEFITANQLSETSEQDQQTIRRFLINDSFDGSSSDQKALQFQLDTSLSLMRASASSRMKTDVQLRLIEDQGLYLIWQDSSSQSIIDHSKIQSFLLSPWVRAIRYGYYESETDTWEYVEAIPESELSPLSQSKVLYSVLLDFEHPQTSKKLSLPIYLSAQVASRP
jgi:prepilin-type N-terminal cleavage/methylation domain-containing protein